MFSEEINLKNHTNTHILTKLSSSERYYTAYFLMTFFYLVILFIQNYFNKNLLTADEAQYWSWSLFLQSGYHSKPPLIAFYIYAVRTLFGNLPWQLKLLQPAISALSSFFVFKTALKLFNHRTAFYAAIFFLFTETTVTLSSDLRTESLMLLFGAIAFYMTIKIYFDNKLRYWLVLAISLGLSILTNYSGIFFAISFVLSLLGIKKMRASLRTRKPYFALLLLLITTSPTLYYNITHHFITFRHVANQNIVLQNYQHTTLSEKIKLFIPFVLSQPGTLSPIPFILFFFLLFKKQLWIKEKTRILFFFSLPTIFALFVDSLIHQCNAYWTCQAAFAVVILASYHMVRHKKTFLLCLNMIISILTPVFIFIVFSCISLNIHADKMDSIFNISKYFLQQNSLQQSFKTLKKQYPHSYWLFDNRKIYSISLYYGELSLKHIFYWDKDGIIDHDTLTKNESTLGKNFLYITQLKQIPAYIKSHVKSYKLLKPIVIPHRNLHKRAKIWHVYYLMNAKQFANS